MSLTTIARCDECGEKHASTSGMERDGWYEVWAPGEDELILDFCTQQCLVDYFTKEDE